MFGGGGISNGVFEDGKDVQIDFMFAVRFVRCADELGFVRGGGLACSVSSTLALYMMPCCNRRGGVQRKGAACTFDWIDGGVFRFRLDSILVSTHTAACVSVGDHGCAYNIPEAGKGLSGWSSLVA